MSWQRIAKITLVAWLVIVGSLVTLSCLETFLGYQSLQSAKALIQDKTHTLPRSTHYGMKTATAPVYVPTHMLARSTHDGMKTATAPVYVPEQRVEKLNTHIHQGAIHLERANAYLSNPLVTPIKWIPFVGRQFESAEAMTNAGAVLSDSANHALLSVRRSVNQSHRNKATAMADISKSLATFENQLNQLNQVRLGPNSDLISPLAKARNEISTDIEQLQTSLVRVDAGVDALSTLLNGHHKYLLLAANNAEMRAGSGMFLSVGLLQVDDGSINVSDMQTVGKVQAPEGAVQWTGDLQQLWGWLGVQNDFRNLMVSPRFDVAAPIAAEVWEKAGNSKVDGVMVIDPVLLSAMLKATGPVQTEEKEITSENVLHQLFYQQYETYNGTKQSQSERREGLSEVARSVFSKLDQGKWDPVVLARELGKVASGRHVLIWEANEQQNARWQQVGVAGALKPTSLTANVVNLGGNKLDQFLELDARIELRSQSKLAVVIKASNKVPTDAPFYVGGPSPKSGLEKNEYQGMLSLDLPSGSSHASFVDELPLQVNGPDGEHLAVGTLIRLKKGESKTFTLLFDRDSLSRELTIESSARVPAIRWHFGSQSWLDDHIESITY